MIKVNAIGDACPIPVVKTKNAIRELGGSGVVEVSVDNEIAVQNLLKMAKQKEYEAEFEKKSNTEYIVTINVNGGEVSSELPGYTTCKNSVLQYRCKTYHRGFSKY